MFRFFKHKRPAAPVASVAPESQVPKTQEQWVPVPNFLPVDPHQEPTVVAIATAVATATGHGGRLHLTRLAKPNPEAQRVALIAASVAAATSGQQFVVKSIRRKVSGADET